MDARPELGPGLQLYMDAFRFINSRRQLGMAEQPLTLSEIETYARVFNFDGTELPFFVRVVCALDDTLLKYRAAERKRKEEANKARKPVKRR